MEDDNKQSTLERIQNVDISKKSITRRVKRAEGVTLRHARKFIFKRLDNAREARRHVVLWIILLALTIFATGVQLVWYRQAYRVQTVSESGTYAEGVVGKIETLNPFYASTSAEEALSQLTFSRLLNYDDSGTINYDLASSMTVSQDAKTYSFTIRNDVNWQDGEKLTVDDVIFTYNLLKNPSTRSSIQGWSEIVIEKINDDTIRFTLPSVIAAFPHAIAAVPILPEHILKTVTPSTLRENAFSSMPIGSGPFVVRLVQDTNVDNSERSILMEKFAGYFKGAAKIDRFQLSTYPTIDALAKALKSGEVTAASGLETSQINQLSTDKYDLHAQPINGGVYALFNTRKPLLTDVKIRKALQLAIDTTKVRQELALSVPAMDLPLTNRQLGSAAPHADAYDINRAATLLNETGWVLDGTVRKKDGKELVLSVVTVQGQNEKVLESIVSQWRQIGVVATTSVYDPTDVTQRFVQDTLQARNYDVLIYPLSIGGDPDVYAYWDSSQAVSSGYNFSNYSNSVSDDALSSARSRVEPELRKAKYLAFSRQWLADVPAIGLYQSVLYYAHSKSVTSFDDTNSLVSSENRYSDVLYWSASTRPVYKTP